MNLSSPAAFALTERPFIGRRHELDALEAAVRRTLSGQPQVVLLSGEPGIGKTRTAQEIVRRAAAQQVLTLWGRCPEEPGAPPYWPWLQLIRRYVALHEPETLATTIASAAGHIAALDPELATAFPNAQPVETEPDAAKARFRLFDAIAGFWQRAALRTPLVLVIDDLHRADIPSLRLLEFIAAEAGASRLMLLGTYRDAEVTRHHPLSASLSELHRHAPVQRLLLGGFSAAETAQFIAVTTGRDAAEFAAALHDRTAGHPLFLAELARDLPPAHEPPGASAPQGPPRLPKGVRGVIDARLSRLSPQTVQVLQAASVLGREFRLGLLHRLLDELSETACDAAVDEARSASLLVDAGDPRSLQFSHALVRDSLYDELPAAQRQVLHQRIGSALEDLHAGDLTPYLSALAHHWHAAGPAGDPSRAIGYATRAAERATALQAHEEAARHYLRAIAALRPGRDQDAERCRLLIGLGGAQNSAGASAVALATYAQAAACARGLGDATLLARSAIGFGDAQWRLGVEGSEAVVLIREALERLGPADSRLRTGLLTTLCQALLFANQPAEAEEAFHEAVALARHEDDPLTLFRALCAVLPGRWFPGRLALRIAAAREAMEVVRRAGHPEWVAPYLSGWHTGDLMEAGDTPAAAATARFHLATGETKREPFNEAVALAALAMIATHEGRFTEAESLATQALHCGARFDRDNAAGIFGAQMFTLRRHQGRLREAAPVLERFLASAPQSVAWRPGLAILHCELGARSEAREAFEQLAAGGFARIPRDAIRIASLGYLAEVCVWLDDARRAAILYELLTPYSGRNIVFGAHTASFGAADRLLGMLATTLQRWDAAEAHFQRAIAFDEHTGGRPWLARSRFACATMLQRRSRGGDSDAARVLLEAALEDACALGMQGVEADVRALQAALGSAEAQAEPGAPTANLSARELQVLRLVAEGRTNREIASTLFRSPNTIANHVRSILEKTGAANRAEASAFAVRHGLTGSESVKLRP